MYNGNTNNKKKTIGGFDIQNPLGYTNIRRYKVIDAFCVMLLFI